MSIRKKIKALFSKWLFPVAIYGSCVFLFILSGTLPSIAQNIAGITLCVGLIVLLTSSVYQFSQKRWKEGVASIGISVTSTILALVLYLIVATAVPMIDGDHWADNLKIPDNIPIENFLLFDEKQTLGLQRPDSILNLRKSQRDLVLYQSGQPGIYKYDFWIDKIETGAIYLKAFEITKGEELSTAGLRKRSNIPITNPTDSIRRFGLAETFKIYEGDWGKYYAARFEVWFKPAANGMERKLFQKNFKIEGWMH